ncbi:MAG: small ribosomal subunit biogenesis GTPase RsgA, partial [Halioglobus sp.]|nr:small ribosomal subunit biogenesis GTPase RsgA [Halioglobus sp.]
RARRAERREANADDALASGAVGPEREGLITAHYGTQVAVETPAGEQLRCHLRANLEGLVTGDRVVWCEGNPMGVVVAQLERKSALLRPDAHGNLKPVAANIDQILIVIAPLPEPHANLVDRYLVAAEGVGIEPVIVLNKCDLLEGNAALGQKMDALLAGYPALGYRVVKASALDGGTHELRAVLSGHTSVFVGQSGVGKSSLVNRLIPEAALRVGALSETVGKGTHTTTTAHLLHLDCGGTLIDSPGIREFGLWHMDRASIERGFIEFRPLLGHCRFRDCSHTREPDCALLAATERGEISARRMDSYRHIVAGITGC